MKRNYTMQKLFLIFLILFTLTLGCVSNNEGIYESHQKSGKIEYYNSTEIRQRHLDSLNALREENEANTEMLDNFYTYLETDDKKYLKLANNQLREILKGAGFGILLVLPFSPITIPYLLKRAQKLGIDIIPALYKKLDLNDEENKLK